METAPIYPLRDMRCVYGLGMVQQHFTLIPVFTALQNIVLAKEPCKLGVILDYGEAEEKITALATQLGFDVPLNTPVESLPIGTQQHTEILKSSLSRCGHPYHG